MPFNQQHNVLSWAGSFRAGDKNSGIAEIFSGSMRFAGPGLDQAQGLNIAGSLALVLSRYWQAAGAKIPTGAFLEVVKWNRIGTDGKYTDQNTVQVVVDNVQGNSGKTYPPQVSWATTWQTDVVRGKACRGRTYWPTAVTIEAETYSVGQAFCTTKATLDAELIRNLNFAARTGYVDNPPTENTPQWLRDIGWVASPTQQGSGVSAMVMSSIGAGTSRVITSAGVGKRLDIQRRRGNEMPDTRTTVDTNSGA